MTDGDFTDGSTISGGMGIDKLGPNALTFAGDNSYTGGTTISEGTLQVDNVSALGVATNSLNVCNVGELVS